jgi:hypothetical protein
MIFFLEHLVSFMLVSRLEQTKIDLALHHTSEPIGQIENI